MSTQAKIGEIFDGKYKIKALIGVGGMANVYQAQDIKTGDDFAIKILKSEFSKDLEFVRRFKSEAQAVINLSHDNIVKLIDVNTSGENNYIVLELIQGITLKQEINKNAPFSNKRAIDIAIALCDALGHANSRNIIHRDVKPQNIIINKNINYKTKNKNIINIINYNSEDIVKITDFGIARFTDASTQTYMGASVMGSVHYISPEAARGEAVDCKSDIYSLGIVLYEMLTGKVPFDSDNTVSVAIKHLQEKMTEPISINPNITPALNLIILKATDKNKNLRYNSMKEFAKDLARATKEPKGDYITQTDKIKLARDSSIKINQPISNLNNLSKLNKLNFFNIAAILVVGIGLFFTMFFIVNIINQQKIEQSLEIVPQLVGKLEDDANNNARKFGFITKVKARVDDPNHPEGTIIEQEPKSGSSAASGSVINVTISQGSELLPMKDFSKLTLDEAKKLAKEWGYIISSVKYQYSDKYNINTVISQIPETGTMVEVGESVELWVSGEPNVGETVPTMVNLNIEEAAQIAQASGFSKIFVREREVSSGVAQGTVLSQTPAGGLVESKDVIIELEIEKVQNQEFGCDVAINLNLEKQSNILVTIKKNNIEYVVYSKQLQSGMQVVPFTVRSTDQDDLNAIVYVDNIELRQEVIKINKLK